MVGAFSKLFLLLQCLAPAPTGWEMLLGQPTAVTQVAPNGASFAFAQSLSGSVSDYLVHSYEGSLSGTFSLAISVTTSGPAIFNKDRDISNTCSGAPAAHLFFSSAPNSVDDNEYHRWWAKASLQGAAYTLVAGSATLSMALTPANWIDANGLAGDANATATAGFNDALANAKYIGVTFGGGCFYGHGVSVSGGTAQFQILDYSVQ